MAGGRNPRVYFLCGGVFLVLLVVYIATPVPTQSREYLQGLLDTAQDWRHGSLSNHRFKDVAITGLEDDSGDFSIESILESVSGKNTAVTPTATLVEASSTLEARPDHTIAAIGGSDTIQADDTAAKDDDSLFNFEKGFFQADLPWFELPKFDLATLKALPPHNYRGAGHETFATYFASRESSMADPYFLASLQIVYRLLWDSRSKSSKHPVTVFVAPFVAERQRDYFAAAGAIVRELALGPILSDSAHKNNIPGRFFDVFSKLEMWNQTDFSRIVFLDSDAFPLTNIDALFALAPEQTCKEELIRENEKHYASELCQYVFTGRPEDDLIINAGVMVLKPNEAMYDLLIQRTHNSSDFDIAFPEQSLLSYVFRPDGPFPRTTLSEAWNGFPSTPHEGGALYVLHAKIWAKAYGMRDWTTDLFNGTWFKMTDLYESDNFMTLRKNDAARWL